VPTLADRGCHAVSVTDPHGRILCLLDRWMEEQQDLNNLEGNGSDLMKTKW
jgi:hypothetical protein